MKLFQKISKYGYYVADKDGNAIDRNGELSYHPVPTKKGEYPECKDGEQKGLLSRWFERIKK